MTAIKHKPTLGSLGESIIDVLEEFEAQGKVKKVKGHRKWVAGHNTFIFQARNSEITCEISTKPGLTPEQLTKLDHEPNYWIVRSTSELQTRIRLIYKF